MTAAVKESGVQLGGFSAKLSEVSPAMAKRWLERNHPQNRAINWRWVESIANDLRAGAYKLSHQAICFDGAGYLVDGQHRLSAVVTAGVAATMLVVHNGEAKFGDPIDRGRPRSVAFLMGKQSRYVSALNTLRALEAGYLPSTPLTVAEAQGVDERHGHALELLRSTVTSSSKLVGPCLASCAWALPIAEARVIKFATEVATGEMIQRGDPSYALRLWFERNQGMGGGGRGGYPKALATLNALRAHVREEALTSVFVGETGYRWVTQRRRALKVANTPAPAIVPAVGDVKGNEKRERAKKAKAS